MPQRSTVYDRDGKVYSRLQGENRIVVPIKEVSPHFIAALVAREDSRFFTHCGVDPMGILRAILRNVIRRGAAQGASTLTQQLARNSFPERLSSRKSIWRKLKEAFLAIRIEQNFSKEIILESYLNRICFGSGCYGLEAASMVYFDKHASELNLGEAATIAGIIRSPGRFSPLRNLKGAQRERDTVLERMVSEGEEKSRWSWLPFKQDGLLDRLVKEKKITEAQAQAVASMITEDQAEEVKKTPLAKVIRKRLPAPQANYAMDAVRRELDILLSDPEGHREDGGLKIYTTIDAELQAAAEKSIDRQLRKVEARPGYSHPKRSQFSARAKEEELETPYLQGALMVIDNRDGAIRALVGGRDYGESKYNRAILPQAARQVGSTFKPFVYAAAYAKGFAPGMLVSDGPLQKGEINGAGKWRPENSDGQNKGLLPMEEGLIQSRNTMTVRVGERAGLQTVGALAESVGFTRLPNQPVEYLGTFESTVSGVASAYAVLANQGVHRQTFLIEKIEDEKGLLLYRAGYQKRQAVNPGAAWMVTNTMEKVFERGTAAPAKELGFTKPAAGKTGTTNDYRDAWFAGYTSSLTCAVWVGLDHPQTIVPKGYGAALALPIWVDVMNAAPAAKYPAKPFAPPADLRKVAVCSVTGCLSTPFCEQAGTRFVADLPASCVPRASCRGGHGDGESSAQPSVDNRGIFRRFFSQ